MHELITKQAIKHNSAAANMVRTLKIHGGMGTEKEGYQVASNLIQHSQIRWWRFEKALKSSDHYDLL